MNRIILIIAVALLCVGCTATSVNAPHMRNTMLVNFTPEELTEFMKSNGEYVQKIIVTEKGE